MKAAISGRAAAAIILDGETWLKIDGEDDEVKPAQPRQWPYVFGVSEDVQFAEGTLDEIRGILSKAVDEDQALTLALICLDMASEFSSKNSAAANLNEIAARTPSAMQFLWRVFSAKPLPSDASPHEARRASTGQAHEFFERLILLQPVIANVHQAWTLIPRDTFDGVNATELAAFATHAGICQKLVEAVDADVEARVGNNIDIPVQWPSSKVRNVFAKWSTLIGDLPRTFPTIQFVDETAVAPRTQERPTLFAAPDPELEQLEPIDFHSSLINAILLHRQLLIPDVYFFTSKGIANHFANKHTHTLLETALAAGLVVAACRYRGADFETTYRVMRRQRFVCRESDYVDRLQQAADRNEHGSFLYWPSEGVSKSYEEYLAILEADDPPAAAVQAGGSVLQKNWTVTRPWRKTLIAEAREATYRRGGAGIHKRVLFRRLVKAVVGSTPPEIASITDLLQASRELRERVHTFWSWASEAHRFSRAKILDALIYSPGYRPAQNLFVMNALGAVDDMNPLNMEVSLPSTDALKQLSATQIIELRQGAGAKYFDALADCRRHPEQRDKLKAAVEEYAAKATRLCTERIGTIKVKRVSLNIGLPSREADMEHARKQQFLKMTTFDSVPDKLMSQWFGRENKKTDVCVVNELPKQT